MKTIQTWDSYENDAWKNPSRKPNPPFFQVLNSAGCHESYLHQPGYMQAADVANFATPADLPKLVALLGSSDEGYRYWGVCCCSVRRPAASRESSSP